MEGERNKLYDSAGEFFALGGSVAMYLTSAAAVEVCLEAIRHGLIVARIEGGLWRNPGFEARLDCIWNGADPPVESSAAIRNNREAADFIQSESRTHDAFVLTAPPLSGWPHKR